MECIGDTDKSIILCDDCGKIGVLSIETALDIINNLYLDRELPEGLMELIDNIDKSDHEYTNMMENGWIPPLEDYDDA